VLALLLPHATISEASACTNATIGGAYGLTATGAIFASNGARADIALLGRALYDGQGGLTGMQIDSTDGSLERNTLAGTYTVRPDCTGEKRGSTVGGSLARRAERAELRDTRSMLILLEGQKYLLWREQLS
jgi:hypothetical protein